MSFLFFNSICIEFINSIILQCTYNILNYELICNLISKKDVLYWLNIYNFIYYLFYKWVQTLIINIYFYTIQIFLIFIYNNMPATFVKSSMYYIMLTKIRLQEQIIKFSIHVKKDRVWRYWYKFYYIDYLKFLFFLFWLIIFLLMWRRRTTYKKRYFIGNLLKFYFLSLFFSFIFVSLFNNTFISIILSLFLAFFCILLTLN